ncbi:MAG: hypothetical protein HOP36_07875 [Methyloglobulus sp.]|nr:hypothetical protein [Methyloglobulus sp.]
MVMYVVWAGLALVAVLLILDLIYFVHGSFEMFPTEERQSAIRLTTGILAVMFTLVEVCLLLMLRFMKRKAATSKLEQT